MTAISDLSFVTLYAIAVTLLFFSSKVVIIPRHFAFVVLS